LVFIHDLLITTPSEPTMTEMVVHVETMWDGEEVLTRIVM
jgi:hypothetical protein